MYNDKYENHFLNIVCGRARFADFGSYTLNALQGTEVPIVLQAQIPALKAALASFGRLLVSRSGREGVTQDHTAAENALWNEMRMFISRTDVIMIQPTYFANAAGLKAIYPEKLSGLTQATKASRLTRFEVYTNALEAAASMLGDEPGKAARQLLNGYRAAADAKDTAESNVAGLIKLLGPEAEALCWALWDVHCAAITAYARNPERARALFNYTLLPKRRRASPKKAA